MDEFIATHVIETGTRRIYVHAEPSDDGGLSFYTKAEWHDASAADWTWDEDNGLRFRGSASAPICHGASFVKFADCRWTHTDGWNDDGTMDDSEDPPPSYEHGPGCGCGYCDHYSSE